MKHEFLESQGYANTHISKHDIPFMVNINTCIIMYIY